MIGANRQVDKDWSEFESYATNLYARSLLTSQPLSASIIGSSSVLQEKLSSSDKTAYNSQLQSNVNYSDVKLITDEIISLRKTILDLRNNSEEVRLH